MFIEYLKYPKIDYGEKRILIRARKNKLFGKVAKTTTTCDFRSRLLWEFIFIRNVRGKLWKSRELLEEGAFYYRLEQGVDSGPHWETDLKNINLLGHNLMKIEGNHPKY
jgi:hypothetical protein